MSPLILLVGVGIVSISSQLLAYRLKIPAILPLLVAGIFLGPIGGVLEPDALFGELLFPIVSLSVAIILFEGALTLKFKDIENHGAMVRNLCSIGALVTWLVVTPVAYFALDISWQIAFLFGAIVTVTGPTVIVPMLRSVRPTAKVSNILRWEGIIIDPIGALLAVLVYEYIVSTQDAWSHTMWTFGLILMVGFGIGSVMGQVLGVLIRKNAIPHYLKNTAVLTLMLGAFAASNTIIHESGLLSVTVMGIWMANMRNLDIDDILEFKETLSVLLISALFIILAARIEFSAIWSVGIGALLVLFVIMLIARPLSVVISSLGTDLNIREIGMLSWVAPRGIVAAAVSSLFALKLEENNIAGAELLVPMVFLVIVATVFIQSLTAKRLAIFLKVKAPPPKGILIFGASRFARMLALELYNKNFNVLLADTNWASIREARMENLPTYYGNPSSEHASLTLDLSTYGRVLVLSPYKQLNPIVTFHFEYVFGKGKVFGMSTGDQARASHRVSDSYSKKLGLFSEDINYGKIASLTSKGAKIKTTKLGEAFTIENYLETYGDRVLPLCAIDTNNKLHFYTISHDFKEKPGWEIISLISAEKGQDE